MAQPRRALKLLVVLALCAIAAVPAAGAPVPDDELVLWRSQGKGGGAVDFFLRGARPDEEVFFELTDAEERPPVATPFGNVRADVAGQAWFSVPLPDESGADDHPFFVHAYVVRPEATPDQRLFSNFVLLRQDPALYLLVDNDGAGARVLHFDPRDRTLDEMTTLEDGTASYVAATESTALVGDARRIVALDGDSAAELLPGEVTIDLEVTPDRSAVLAMTRESLAGGRSLLRLRLLEAADLTHEIGSLELLRGSSRLVAARLVTGDDSQRVLFVASQDGMIREVTLGAEPGRGLTFLPLTIDGEELLDVKVEDDLLVAVTRSPRPRRVPSRMIVLDLRARATPFEKTLAGAALDFELARTQGRLAAFVALTGGRIEVAALEPNAPSAFVDLAGVSRLRRGPHGDRLFALSETRVATVNVVDLDALTRTPLPLPLLSTRISDFGLLGSGQRTWLYLVETERGGSDQLWCFELDFATNVPIDLQAPLRLAGSVREIATR